MVQALATAITASGAAAKAADPDATKTAAAAIIFFMLDSSETHSHFGINTVSTT